MLQIKTDLNLRDAILYASDVAASFEEKDAVAEALTLMIAKQYNIPAGRRLLRVFVWVTRIKPIPKTTQEVFEVLNALVP